MERLRCSGQWTESRYQNFIRGVLRGASRKWAPINEVKKEAWVERGKYKCNGCKKVVPLSTGKGKNRKQNIFVDHIAPVVDPHKGFETWDIFIERLFCEKDNLQLLCKTCHDKKTSKEKEIATRRQ